MDRIDLMLDYHQSLSLITLHIMIFKVCCCRGCSSARILFCLHLAVKAIANFQHTLKFHFNTPKTSNILYKMYSVS